MFLGKNIHPRPHIGPHQFICGTVPVANFKLALSQPQMNEWISESVWAPNSVL